MERAFVTLGLTLLLAAGASANGLFGRSSDSRIRVTTKRSDGVTTETIQGRLSLVEDEALTVAVGRSLVRVPREAILLTEVRRDQSRGAGSWRGARYGAMAGVVGGALLGATDDNNARTPWSVCVAMCGPSTATSRAVVAAFSIGFLGGALGAVAGAALPGTHWSASGRTAWL